MESNETVAKKFLTAEEILAADDRKPVDVFIPEWGGWLKFMPFSGTVAMEFQQQVKKGEAERNEAWITIIGLAAVKEDGSRLFTDAQVEMLKEKNAAVFVRLQDVLSDLNGFKKDAVDQAKNA